MVPCGFTLILMILLTGYAHADEVIMKNGDRLQGEIISMEEGKLIFKTPYASKTVIPWDQVEHLTSEKILEISLPDKEVVKLVFAELTNALVAGDRVEIRGLGSFKELKERVDI